MLKLSKIWLVSISSNLFLCLLKASIPECIITFCYTIFQVHIALFVSGISYFSEEPWIVPFSGKRYLEIKTRTFSSEISTVRLNKRFHIGKANDPSSIFITCAPARACDLIHSLEIYSLLGFSRQYFLSSLLISLVFVLGLL